MNILITGASRGLGRSLAVAFSKAGHDLILTGRDGARLDEVGLMVQERDADCHIVIGDIRHDATMDALESLAVEHGLDILVNNAGIYQGPEPENIIQTNLIAPIKLTLLLYPIFEAKGSGLIININSLAGKTFNDQEAVYCASKWGLRGFMGSFKYEARKHGVNVLDIYLGGMKTGMREGGTIDPDDAAEQIVALCGDGKSLAVTEVEIVRAGR